MDSKGSITDSEVLIEAGWRRVAALLQRFVAVPNFFLKTGSRPARKFVS